MKLDELPQEWQSAIDVYSFHSLEMDLLNEALSQLYFPRRVGKRSFIAPDPTDVFRAFRLTLPDQVRVVILGKDPYPQEHPDPSPMRRGVADGLAFSSAGLWPQASLTPLLWNLRKSGLQTEAPCGADLQAWAKRGVLLLNATLVYSDTPIDHASRGVFRGFMRAVLAHCVSLPEPPAFLILGSDAWATARPILGSLPPEQVICARHPSRPPWPGPKDRAEPFVALNAFLGARRVDWGLD